MFLLKKILIVYINNYLFYINLFIKKKLKNSTLL